jgi:hypothetical protein
MKEYRKKSKNTEAKNSKAKNSEEVPLPPYPGSP